MADNNFKLRCIRYQLKYVQEKAAKLKIYIDDLAFVISNMEDYMHQLQLDDLHAFLQTKYNSYKNKIEMLNIKINYLTIKKKKKASFL